MQMDTQKTTIRDLAERMRRTTDGREAVRIATEALEIARQRREQQSRQSQRPGARVQPASS